MSTNTFYNPAHFANGKVPATLVAKNLMLAYKWGIKTIYYSLINKVGAKVSIGNTEIKVNDFGTSIVEVAPEEYAEDDCEACKL